MWYIADLLFAQLPVPGEERVTCESCNVLFEARSASEVYDRASTWAESHIEGTAFHFLGVTHIHSLSDSQPTDGTEVGGHFFDDVSVWERRDELIPEKDQIPVITWEQNCDMPIGDMMTAEQKKKLKEILRSD
jgi:hypothetical protein